MEISKYIQLSDLVIITLPRNGGISYKINQEGIPRLMAKNFENHNFILIYPNDLDDNQEMMFSEDFDNNLIDEGLNQLSKRAKNLTGVFRKK